MLLARGQRLGQVRRLHEAVIHLQPVEAATEVGELDALCVADIGDVERLHGGEQYGLVQRLVVLQVVQQRRGNALRRRGQEDGATLGPRDTGARQLQDGAQRDRLTDLLVADEFAAPLPGRQNRERGEPDEQREPAALWDLYRVGGEEGEVHQQQPAGEKCHDHPVPAPQQRHHEGDEMVSIIMVPVTAMP